MECVGAAWRVFRNGTSAPLRVTVHRLLKRGPAPPPVYQGQHDPKALFGALKVFLSQ
ncbi:MAG: hypothetical protein QOH05_4607 [Acetobacteraceae bacterium]|jgi:hypothetical protein|nr:hypothetical protein [Acetobacteraceae bacterium]